MTPTPTVIDQFQAPWGGTLKVLTGLALLILVGVAIAGVVWQPPGTATNSWFRNIWWLSMVVLPLVFAVGSSCFTIRGYTLTSEVLWVERLGWRSRIYLSEFVTARMEPQAMRGSIRTFGNGGLFCIAGRFWSQSLGHYRAFVTDFDRTVVLEFSNRTVVVSPDRPADLMLALNEPEEPQ